MAYDLSLGAVRALAMPEFEHRMGVILQQQGCKGFERHPSVANFMSGMTVAQVMNNTPIDIAGTLPPAALINAAGAPWNAPGSAEEMNWWAVHGMRLGNLWTEKLRAQQPDVLETDAKTVEGRRLTQAECCTVVGSEVWERVKRHVHANDCNAALQEALAGGAVGMLMLRAKVRFSETKNMKTDAKERERSAIHTVLAHWVNLEDVLATGMLTTLYRNRDLFPPNFAADIRAALGGFESLEKQWDTVLRWLCETENLNSVPTGVLTKALKTIMKLYQISLGWHIGFGAESVIEAAIEMWSQKDETFSTWANVPVYAGQPACCYSMYVAVLRTPMLKWFSSLWKALRSPEVVQMSPFLDALGHENLYRTDHKYLNYVSLTANMPTYGYANQSDMSDYGHDQYHPYGGRGGGGKGRGGNKGRGGKGKGKGKEKGKEKGNDALKTCYGCGLVGHIRAMCPTAAP